MQKNLFQREEAELLKKKSCCPILAPLCQNGATMDYCWLAINNMGVEIVMQQDEEEEENSNG